ncbi:MAG: tetratricopeptide repeat protein [Nitrospirae bacterium]|nr:tetratricopeptide repeat protein [Nitrospirota bacterium]
MPKSYVFINSVLCSLLFALFIASCATMTNPEDMKEAEGHNKLGSVYLSTGQLNEAHIEFQKALQLDPKNKETYTYLGHISSRYRKYDEAVTYYKRAISLDPNYSDAMNNLGVVYLDMENWDEAIKYFTAALNNPLFLTPERAYSSMGYAYYKKGDYDSAAKVLKEALIRNPVFPVANFNLGLVYVKLGDDRSAIDEFSKAIAIMPDYMDAHWELAKSFLRSGERSRALEHFRIVAEKDRDIKRSREALEYVELLK